MSFIKSKKLDVDKIAKGHYLDQAKEIGVEVFFAKRIQNKVRKALVGNWLILIESASFTYIGYPRFKSLFSNKRITEQLFKVNTKLLNQLFPSYRSIQGNDIHLQLYTLLSQELSVSVSNLHWAASLHSKHISISANCQYFKAQKTVSITYQLQLDSNTLALMHLEKLS